MPRCLVASTMVLAFASQVHAITIPERQGTTVRLGLESLYRQGTDLARHEEPATFLAVHAPILSHARFEGKAWQAAQHATRSESINVHEDRLGVLAGFEVFVPWYFRWTLGLGVASIKTTARTQFAFEDRSTEDVQVVDETAFVTRAGIDYAVIDSIEVSLHLTRHERQERHRRDYGYGLAIGYVF